MDKRMMDKINEAMKANGKRELSLDEMDRSVAAGRIITHWQMGHALLNWN